jgi:hypothetical protein
MSELRWSDRKRTQTQSFMATEALGGKTKESQLSARRAREAAVASAYDGLVGLVQLRGGGGRVWVGEPGSDGGEESPAIDCFAPSRASRVTEAAARPMVYSCQQPSGEQLVELFRSSADLVLMDREAAGSGGCSSTSHGRLGAGVTISIDVVPGVFGTGLLRPNPICYQLFNQGTGVQGSSASSRTAAATAARSAKAVEQVYERFEAACDDLDSGLFDLDLDKHCYCCMQFRVQGHRAPQQPLPCRLPRLCSRPARAAGRWRTAARIARYERATAEGRHGSLVAVRGPRVHTLLYVWWERVGLRAYG